jgi:prepilin-type N-terminal cleavage/methylation domain-containing protein
MEEKRKDEVGKRKGFTLIELLVVIAIIAILAALVLQTAGYVQRKGATSRAEAEVAALSAALESYKADMGDYPTGTNGSDTGTASPGTNNAFLRAALAPDGSNSLNPLNKVYFEFAKGMGNSTNVSATNQPVLDPFGEGYGYQYQGSPNRSGTNFFDLWSRAGSTNTNAWIKNW